MEGSCKQSILHYRAISVDSIFNILLFGSSCKKKYMTCNYKVTDIIASDLALPSRFAGEMVKSVALHKSEYRNSIDCYSSQFIINSLNQFIAS